MRKPKDWGQPCPNPACGHYKLMNRGNVKSIATYETQSGKRRIFQCSECGEQFSETRDTVFFDLRTPEEKVMIVLKLLLCKVELTAISFAMGVTEETILDMAAPCGRESGRDQPALVAGRGGDPGGTGRIVELRLAQTIRGARSEWRKSGREQRWSPVGVGEFCPRISSSVGHLCGTTHLSECAEADPVDRSRGPGGARLLQRWLQLLSVGSGRSLPSMENLSANGTTRSSQESSQRTSSRPGLCSTGQGEATWSPPESDPTSPFGR